MLFSPFFERFNLIVPLVALLALGLNSIFGIHSAPASGTWPFLLAAVIGSGHTILTFLFLSAWPKGRDLAGYIIRRSRAGVIFAGLIFFMIVFYFSSSSETLDNSAVIRALSVILLVLFAQHALGQIRGLSLLYNRKLLVRADELKIDREEFSRIEAWERRLFGSLIFIIVCQALDDHFYFGRWDDIFIVLSILNITAILLLSFLLPGSRHSNKSIFLMRLLLFPFAGIYPEAYFALFFVHGLEYELTIFKILGKETSSAPKVLLSLNLLILFIAFPFFHHALTFVPDAGQSWLLALPAFAKVVDYFHYYVDSVIFRFSDRGIKERLLPSLISLDSSQDEASQ